MSELHLGPLTLLLEENETYTVTDCATNAVEVTVPAEVNGIRVAKVADYAFEDCTLLTSVTFEEKETDGVLDELGLEEIGAHAFMGCISLARIVLPWRLDRVGWGCFHSCSALREVECNPYTYFSGYAFAHCTALTGITPLHCISEGLFSHCASLSYLPLAEGVDTISEDAFEHCDALLAITIPASVTRIEALAFRGCYDLKTATFERTECWYGSNSYRREDVEIDVSNPAENARDLAWMDFDDGEIAWYRKTRASRRKKDIM